jgi:hypothetical protein
MGDAEMTRRPRTSGSTGVRIGRLVIVALAGVLLGVGSFHLVRELTTPHRTTPVYEPPVLAGQQLYGACAGGGYARLDDKVVLTSTGHCTAEGTIAYEADGVTVRGIFGPSARDATCPYAGHTCASSDINYLVVAPGRIPWRYLNVVDMGVGGYRVLAAGTKALSCADVKIGDRVEIDGRNTYREGKVLEKGANLQDPKYDGSYFPCMIVSDVQVASGDSGGVVLVNGIPAGVTSRTFGGNLGFTPLAEGLTQLGLELCTTPNCELDPSAVPE